MKDLHVGNYEPEEDDDDVLSSKVKGNSGSWDDSNPLMRLAAIVAFLAVMYIVYMQATAE